MNLPKPLFLFWRVCVAAFILLTSGYCLLAYVPFTYQQMVVAAPLPWLATFVKFHPYIYWGVVIIQVLTMRRRQAKIFAIGFAVLGVFLLIHPVLASLENDIKSLYWGLVFLLLLPCLAVVDWLEEHERLTWEQPGSGEDHRIFHASWQSAVFLGLLYSGIYKSWMVVPPLAAFMALFVALFLLRAVARTKMEFALCCISACLFVAAVLRLLVFPAISLYGPWANIYALAAGISFGTSFAGSSLRVYGPNTVDSGLALLLTPLRWTTSILLLPAIALLAYLLAVWNPLLDWNFLRQKLSALFIGAVTFATAYELNPRKESLLPRSLLLIPAIVILGACLLFAPDFRLGDAGRSSFYSFLIANTNITAAAAPVEVNLVDHLTAGRSPKPNIFIFVIDSLRRDYVSPYHPAVTFTPNIEAFARESVVMQNAFTRYGGTALSEPSIWVGGMLLHKQYVTPFYPMNTLQKLVEGEGYRSFIGQDPILKVVLRPSPAVTEVDSNIPNRPYDCCKTLADLEDRILTRKVPDVPMFFYAQPQNIHVWTLNQEGESVPAGEAYPGFYAPVAYRIRQMDLCWRKFIEFMKKSGLYDKSIIILTADHGDSMGEGGRWGHSTRILPEVVRIPLIIHLPPALRSRSSFDPGKIAFLTDLTPSLYYLLGHKPVRNNEILGRPLFTETPEEQNAYLRDSYLIASSYGPVYGILKNNGHSLYIVDASEQADSLYDIPNEGDPAKKPTTAAIQAENEKLIRDGILAINRFYGFEHK